MIERLIDAGATRIAVAIDFSTPSDVQNDRRLAAALARAGPERVALPVFRPRGGEADQAQQIVEPLPCSANTRLADVRRCVAGPRGVVRHFDLVQNVAGAAIPTVAGGC